MNDQPIHPAKTFAETVHERLVMARTDGYLAGYAVGFNDARRQLIPAAGALLCLGVMLGSIGTLIAMRVSA